VKILNAIPNMGRQSTEDQVREFLTNNKLNLQLGTIDEKGDPNIHPIWFVFEGNSIYVLTSKKSKKAQNIIRKNLVYFSIDDEAIPYKGVKGKASVTPIQDPDRMISLAAKIITKYMGGLDNDIGRWIMQQVKSGDESVFELKPKFYSAWAF
jgi:nitroimidazol reductase NimA-like FMN-containing flavoprotein (pyridoxamine 5'-phosphate oxidase superfamily)